MVGEFPATDAGAVARAVAEAHEAASWWDGLGFAGRRSRLRSYAGLIARRMRELADLIHAENGKPFADAELELVTTIDHLRWAASHAERVLRRRHVSPGVLMFQASAAIEYRPYGVVGVIGPWNYPVFTPMGSISYALAAGNAVVFKPSEFTPAVGRWLGEAFAEVVPERPVLQVVTGLGETGAALAGSGVDKLAFTGSAATGRLVMAACAKTLTPVVIEGGGKDPMVVAADADIGAAADAALWGGLANAGQTCVGVERVYVVDAVYDEFVELLARRARELRPGVDYGPMTTAAQVDVVRRHVEDAIARGAWAIVGGPESIRPPYIDPVILVDVPEDAAAMREETFGPTLTVTRVSDVDAAITRANRASYGLGATVFAGRRGPEFARRLKAGMVSVNSIIAFAAIPALPFGGVGGSGFGRIHGADGLREFARPQAIARQLVRPPLPLMTFQRSERALNLLVGGIQRWYGRH